MEMHGDKDGETYEGYGLGEGARVLQVNLTVLRFSAPRVVDAGRWSGLDSRLRVCGKYI